MAAVSKVHSCPSQEFIAVGKEEPPAKKCTCRKGVTIKRATEMVQAGQAHWVVLKRTWKTQTEVCHICQGKPEKVVNCMNCRGLGEVGKNVEFPIYGNDIVLVSSTAGDTYRPALAMKTPRVATLEAPHIVRAFVLGYEEDQIRVEEYGLMTLQARIDMGIKVEPKDDEKTRTGRKYDYGKAPFSDFKDNRTIRGKK